MTSTSLSINPTLSPPFSIANNTFCSASSAPVFLRFRPSESLRTKPICLSVRGPKGLSQRKKFGIKASDMTITEVRPEEEEEGPPLLDSENNSRPRRIALFVEPSPFA